MLSREVLGKLRLVKVAIFAFVVLLPIVGLATQKEKEAIQFTVVSAKTKIHGQHPPDVFEYTDLMFVRVSGKNVIYECSQRGDLCPLMETGKMYTADRIGSDIYISMTVGEREMSIKYKQVGSW